MKEIFGSMPIDHLTAAQALAKKKQNQTVVIVGFVVVAVVGIYIGYRISENINTRKFDIKSPENDGTERKASSASGKFRYSTANNFSARPVNIRNNQKSKFEPNLDSYLGETEND